ADIEAMYADLRRWKLPSRQIPRQPPDVSRHRGNVRGSAATEASFGPDTQTASRCQSTSRQCTQICGDGSFHRARYPDSLPMSADIQAMYADLQRRKLPSRQIPRQPPGFSRHSDNVRGSMATEASMLPDELI